MRPGVLLVVCSLLFLPTISIHAAAQGVAPSPPQSQLPSDDFVSLSEDQERELTAWLKAMTEWQRYAAKWHNRPARDGMGRITARRPPPDAPSWLGAYCEASARTGDLTLEPRTTTACQLFVDPRAPLESVPTGVQAARIDNEKPPKHSWFLRRIHLDGLWTTASNTSRSYGLVGSHLSLVDVGRLQIFGPPGVLVLSVPDGDGSRRITLGYTWGLSYRVADVRLLGGKDMTLFLNVSKVWIAGTPDNQGAGGYNIAGFSIAPRKKE